MGVFLHGCAAKLFATQVVQANPYRKFVSRIGARNFHILGTVLSSERFKKCGPAAKATIGKQISFVVGRKAGIDEKPLRPTLFVAARIPQCFRLSNGPRAGFLRNVVRAVTPVPAS